MELSETGGLPSGLMAFWASISTQEHAAYTRWHNAEHIPERVSIEGFQRGARYRSVLDNERFLMFYETTGANVLTSDAYLRALNSPTSRTRQALTWFRDPVRNVYRLLAAQGQAMPTPAPLMATVKFASHRPLPGELSIGDLAPFQVRRISVYEIEGSGSSVRTNESSLHGAASAAAGGLVRFESDDLRLLDGTDVWPSFTAAVEKWCANQGIDGLDEIDIGCIDYCQSKPTQGKT